MKNILISATLLLAAAPASAQELTDITPAMAAAAEVDIPAARPYPGQDLSGEKGLKVCWIKTVEKDACVYKCSNGDTLRQPFSFNQDGSYASCPQLVFPLGKPKAAAAPQPEADKKFTVCWIKGVRENTCLYKCNNGKTLEQPMQYPLPGSDLPVAPCPQLVFPHDKADAMKAEEPAAEEPARAKKFRTCWIKKMKEGTCSYKCSDGTAAEEPFFGFVTGNEGGVPLLPCAPVIFQWGGARAAKDLPDFSLDACEAALPGAVKFREITLRGEDGEVLHGFDRAAYRERGPMPVSLVLQNEKDAFFYYESCDIGADLVRCDLKTGRVTPVLSAHSIGCEDMRRFSKGPNYYNACSRP